MNIIIVDDDPFVTGALKTILESMGEITVKATGTDGKEACELYEKYQPDVLLMDIRMRNMDGLKASEKILADAVIDLPENDPAIDRAVKIIEENLIKEMPDCHVTSLHENDAGYAPLLQKYEDKGLETLIIDMDFYVEEDAEPGVFTPGTSYEGYSWMFTRESKDDTWTLEENGFLL